MPKRIYLSPSSQNDNLYAAGNTTEQEQCRRIASACEKALLRCGFEVKNGSYGTMYTRVKESNNWKADLHVAIHTNAANKKVTGTRAFCSGLANESYKATKAIFDELAPLTPGTSENIKVDLTLYEIKRTNCPCAYIEIEFHDVPETALWIVNHTTEIGEAIAKGICKNYNYTYGTSLKPSNSVPQKTQDTNTLDFFVKEVQKTLGAKVDGIAGPETFGKTITVSKKVNRKHPIVKVLQKRLYAIGYTEVGITDGIAGNMFDKAVRHYQKDNGCYVDGEITARNKTWKRLLGMK